MDHGVADQRLMPLDDLRQAAQPDAVGAVDRHLREVAGLSERQLVADRKPLVRAIQEPAGAGRRGVQIGERGDELGVPRGLDDLRERDAARLEPLGID